jgi:hypothetical protein
METTIISIKNKEIKFSKETGDVLKENFLRQLRLL